MRLLLLLLAAVSACGCGGQLRHMGVEVEHVRESVHRIDCRDGAPARILVDVHCVEGICGVTCAPDRWK